MLKNLFKLDLRSLALYRIVVGLILLFDFFNRFKLIDAFYSDNGILSRHDLIQNIEIEWKFTLLNIVGSPVFAYTLAAAGIVASIGIIKGFKTRLSTFVAWILLYSFQNRFPLVNHGGDNLLRLLTFFMLFLPVNQVASLDKFFGPFDFENIKTKDFNVFKVSNLLIFTQIFLMYFFTFFYKWDPSWFDRLDSLYFALNLDLYTTQLGHLLLKFPDLLKVISFLTLWIEGLGPILLLIPFRISFFRTIALILFIGLHLGILLTLHLGNFPWACFVLWIPIIPSSFWEYLRPKTTMSHITLYYDFECGFCRRFCFFVQEFFGLGRMNVSASNSNSDIHRIVDGEKSWCLSIGEKTYIRFEVITQIINLTKFSFIGKVLEIKPILEIGNFFYRNISKHRFTIGKFLNSNVSSKLQIEEHWFKKIIIVFIIALSTAWNFEGYLGTNTFDIKTPFSDTAFILGLNQQWNMFAPKPMSDDGWVVVEGTMSDNQKWDVFNNKKVSFDRPKYIQESVDGTQWRKLFVNLWNKDYISYRPRLTKYICRNWNEKNLYKVNHVNVFFMLERTLPEESKDEMLVSKTLMWEYTCKE